MQAYLLGVLYSFVSLFAFQSASFHNNTAAVYVPLSDK